MTKENTEFMLKFANELNNFMQDRRPRNSQEIADEVCCLLAVAAGLARMAVSAGYADEDAALPTMVASLRDSFTRATVTTQYEH